MALVRLADGTIVDGVAIVQQDGTLTSSTNPAPATIKPSVATYTDRSGSIAVAATSQQLAAANTARKHLIIQNPSTAAGQGIGAAESLYINFTSAAGIGNGSIELRAGDTFESGPVLVTSEVITVYAATIAHKFTAKEA